MQTTIKQNERTPLSVASPRTIRRRQTEFSNEVRAATNRLNAITANLKTNVSRGHVTPTAALDMLREEAQQHLRVIREAIL